MNRSSVKHGRKRLAWLLAVLMVLSLLPVSAFAQTEAEEAIAFRVDQMGYWENGVWIPTDVAPYIDNGRIMVPVAHASRALGAEVEWNSDSKAVTVTVIDDIVSMTIGSRLLMKNGMLLEEMETAAVIKDVGNGLGRTMIPVSRLARALGVNYSWDSETRTAVFVPGASDDSADAVIFDEAGVYGPVDGTVPINNNVVIAADGVTLQNYVINGNLMIAEEVGDGEVILNNIVVKGDTIIRGGGADSIFLNGGQYHQIIVENTPSGVVRIVAIDVNGLEVVLAENIEEQQVILEGNFEKVTIRSSNVTIKTTGSTIIKELAFTEEAVQSGIILSAESVIEKLIADSENISIDGAGTVKSDEGSHKSSIDYGDEVTKPVVRTSSGGGGGGGGGGSSTPTTIAVTSIALGQPDQMLAVGEQLQLTVAIEPDNASNKNVNWTTSNEAVVTVSGTGMIEALAAGQATITATSAGNSSLQDSLEITVQAIVLQSGSLPEAVAGEAYVGYTFTATGGVEPYTFTAPVTGSLPDGMAVNGSQTLGGTPTETGVYIFTVRVTDQEGASDEREFTLTVDTHPDQIAADEVVELITTLPSISELTLEDKADVEAARAAYGTLTAAQKALVTNLAVLEAAETRMDELETDLAAAQSVMDLINALPSVNSLTLDDQADVAAARSAYDALTSDQQPLVTNLAVLVAAEAKITELETDLAAAQSVMDLIDALPAASTLTLDDKADVEAARGAYNALTVEQKLLVSNLEALETAEAKITELIADQEAEDAAEDFKTGHTAVLAKTVDTVAISDKDAVNAALAAYNDLSEAAKSKLTDEKSLLDSLLAKIVELEQDAADQAAAQMVMDLIDALPPAAELTVDNKAEVEAARVAYGALTAAQQALVTNLAVLEAAETKMTELEQAAADQAAADVVIGLITALPSINDLTLGDKSDIEAARDAFNALTAAQQALVSNLAVLVAAEDRIAELETDQAAAAAVVTLIGALPSVDDVTVNDKEAVETARGAFNALTAAQQVLVTNLAKLEAAEAKMVVLVETAANEAAVTSAKTAVEAAVYQMDQADASSEASVKAAVEAVIAGLNLEVTAEVVKVSYQESVAGTESDVNGSDGEYVFTVVLTKGVGDTFVTATTDELSMTVTATPFAPPSAEGVLLDAEAYHTTAGVLYSRDGSVYFNLMNAAGEYGNEVLVGAGTEGSLAVDNSGKFHIAYTTSDGKIGYWQYNDHQLAETLYVESNHGGVCKWPSIDTDHNGQPHILYVDSMGDTAGTTNQPDLMYASLNGDTFTRQLLHSGSYDRDWKQGSYSGEKNPYIAMDGNGHRYYIYQWRTYDHSWQVYHDRGITAVGANSQSLGYVGSNTNRFDLYDLKVAGDKLYALYRDNVDIILSAMALDGLGNIGAPVEVIKYAASTTGSFAVQGDTAVIGGKNGSNLYINVNQQPDTYTDISVAGSMVSVVVLNNQFYALYTDNADGLIQLMLIESSQPPASDDAALSELSVDGTLLDGFSPDTLEYMVTLPVETITIPTVGAMANHSEASVNITQATELPGAATVVVTAEDGTTQVTYTINFQLEANPVTIADTSVAKSQSDTPVTIGDTLTLTVTMSDGEPAAGRVEYFAAVQETDSSTDAVGYIEIDQNSNTFVIPETYTNPTLGEQSLVGMYIDFGAAIIGEPNSGVAQERLGPVE